MTTRKLRVSAIASGVLATTSVVNGLSFEIPSSVPANASAQIDAAPVGLSFEFFAFPEYFEQLSLTDGCLGVLADAYGTSPPIRIGGTTQDRATYNASLSSAVSYTVASPDDAPETLTFGNSFMDIAASYSGSVTIGFNRRLDNINNTIAAAKVATSTIGNLYAIELGNEPNCMSPDPVTSAGLTSAVFTSSDPIADGNSWTAAADAVSQVAWQSSVGTALDKTAIIQAGVFFGLGSYEVTNLVGEEEDTDATQYVRSFCHHYYPYSASTADLDGLMSHEAIVEGVTAFQSQVSAAHDLDKDFVMGETNSATGGGGGISPTFGAGLWILDYAMQAVILGIKQLYFHQGTVGNCPYCWWDETVNAPFFGAYTAALALGGASQVAQLDSGDSRVAAYAIYDSSGAPTRVLLYNSEYYTSGTRSSVNISLSGLSSTTVSAKRLTGDAATTTVGAGAITIGGQTFANGTCALQGTAEMETTTVQSGQATFTVQESEALLIYL
ncbi:hypothetical protein ASPACDRAFT_1891396 [Aspergillus aculeatus ATCC 16872]|uniref:Beta-glucuronidase C-terminal domain-containing protein n=1 Tax=Aspergillus aculeatus (strain ATCC 16872 / CBS 172.66 / WB 5094) TaxID=690307 RepID=A0A1L9WIJ9_ASPA1|nr:uncharacterized protein ASPACDRAFT_1891396 [Aspergillus aculeatus ATCC 16872]OJJ95998.1 hypothetical protein ASPACDRAFT_1891396 [Aspergillus aculeatus ATCC 16872]